MDRASDCQVLILGELRIGNTTVAASVCAHLFDGTIEDLVDRGAGVDDTSIERKIVTVQAALHATYAVTGVLTI